MFNRWHSLRGICASSRGDSRTVVIKLKPSSTSPAILIAGRSARLLCHVADIQLLEWSRRQPPEWHRADTQSSDDESLSAPSTSAPVIITWTVTTVLTAVPPTTTPVMTSTIETSPSSAAVTHWQTKRFNLINDSSVLNDEHDKCNWRIVVLY